MTVPLKIDGTEDDNGSVVKDTEEEDVDIVGSGDEEYSDESDDEDLLQRSSRTSRYDVAFIFELLWRTRKAPEAPRIWLPETIVFRHSHPTGWYFTNTSDGRIMKRNNGQEHFISQKKILEVFDGASGEVTAMFVNTTDLDGKRVAGNVQYFDRQHLREFLYSEDPNRNGFLQRFVSAKQQQYHNAQIQTLHCSWTRGVLRSTNIEQRTCNLRIIQREPDRVLGPTFNYGRADVKSTVQLPVQSSLLLKIQDCCERIVKHIAAVTEGRVQISHLISYFRVGAKGQVWFNFCTSADVYEMQPDHTNVVPEGAKHKGARLAASLHMFSALSGPHKDFSHSKGGIMSPESSPERSTFSHLPPGGSTEHQHLLEEEFMRLTSGDAGHCPLCEEGSAGTQQVQYVTLMKAMTAWHLRKERLGKELHRPFSVGKTTLFPQASHEMSTVNSLWRGMRLRDDDRVTLPRMRALLLGLGLTEESVNHIEVAVAKADASLTGFINKKLVGRAIATAWNDSSPPSDVLAVCSHPLGHGAHPLQATGDEGMATLPRLEWALQRIVGRGDYQRLLPPALADRENPAWVRRTVSSCVRCSHSLSNLAKDATAAFWDDQLDRLFASVMPDVPAHASHPLSYAYTHAPASRKSHTEGSAGSPPPRPPPVACQPRLTRLEREWIRKRRAGELVGGHSNNNGASITAQMGGASPRGGNHGDYFPPLQQQSLLTSRPVYSWSPSVSARGIYSASPRQQPLHQASPGAAGMSDEELIAELHRRNLLKEGGAGGGIAVLGGSEGNVGRHEALPLLGGDDGGGLGPPQMILGDGVKAVAFPMPTPPKTPRPMAR